VSENEGRDKAHLIDEKVPVIMPINMDMRNFIPDINKLAVI
jgi:hypothetical protein